MSDLILASASPRRFELLQQIGVRCIRRPVDIPELQQPGEAAQAFVERLAREKALAGVAVSDAGAVVLGSDTVVVLQGEVMGKPVDKADGIRMLKSLSDNNHQVMTAVAVACGERIRANVVTTEVRFRCLSDAECEAYWETGEPVDKAGGYGIQGLGAVFVADISGSYSAVVGLPLLETAQLLADHGIEVWQDACRD